MSEAEDILKKAQHGDMFVASIGFAEEGIEISYMEASKQSESIMTSQNLFLLANTEEKASMYAELQDLCQIIIRDAFVELRSE